MLVAPGLREHGVGLDVQRRIGMDQIPQLGDGGHQRPRLPGDVLLQPRDPALDVDLILRHPATGAGPVQTGFNGLVHDSSPRSRLVPRSGPGSLRAVRSPCDLAQGTGWLDCQKRQCKTAGQRLASRGNYNTLMGKG